MATRTEDAPPEEDIRREEESKIDNSDVPVPPPAPRPVPPPDHSISRSGNKVFKSGPLFLSSKGIGWTSWKKRWFILTRTSLVFFRSDPSAVPQKGGEVNLTLGGIDLNNSGSVVVKADKKLLTVLFPDGRDGRTFTLKAETLEDLHEWKDALEDALSQAPSAALVMGQNGIFQSDQSGTADGSPVQLKDKQVAKSMVVGRPILLALEEIDGTPSFLEKALRFVEEHGIKVEGILRQAADVDDVEHRIHEYEQGNIEFSSSEDPHVVGDCIKYILRELPSSPVPASCCKALLEACRTDRDNRVSAIRLAICETFPEPNRRLLQRILIMMRNVASHKSENRMSSSAVAACMAPLLLRPLLAGDCELENDFDVGGDGSAQLMQAAAAANHAQAICIHLLEEYEKIFGESDLSPDLYADTEESGSESEDATDYDDDGSYEDDEHDDYTQDSETESENSYENVQSESASASGETETESAGFSHPSGTDGDSIHNDKKADERSSSESYSPVAVDYEDKQKSSPRIAQCLIPNSAGLPSGDNCSSDPVNNNQSQQYDRPALDTDTVNNQAESSKLETPVDQNMKKPTTIASGAVHSMRRPAVWGRTPAKKNLSMESVDFGMDNEVEIERLEAAKVDLQNRVAEETRENAVLLTDLERQRKALHERRIALEQDVARLQEKLQKERDLRKALEAGLKIPRGALPSANIDGKVKADLEDLARAEADINKLRQKVDDLAEEVNKEQEKNQNSHLDLSNEFKRGEDDHGTVVNKEADSKNTSGSHFAKKSITRKNSDRVKIENEGGQESTSYSTKPSNQLVGSTNYYLSGHSGQPPSSQAAEPHSGDRRSLPPVISRRSVSRNEAANTTSSAVTKLTTRLNFLKERRSQIANELQNMDKSRGLGSEVHPVLSQNAESDTGKSNQNAESDTGKSNQNAESDTGKSNQNAESDTGKSNQNAETRVPRDAVPFPVELN